MIRNNQIKLFLFIIGWLISLPTWASHIFGGYLTMTQLNNTQGKYRIDMAQYINVPKAILDELPGLETRRQAIVIFRKRDNKIVGYVNLNFTSKKDLVYDNNYCAKLRKIETRIYYYSATVSLNPGLYSESEGYYMAYEWCCRDADLTNIKVPEDSGITLYLEFPSLVDYPNYSSPVFNFPNGDYICKNRDFSFDFSATDADGDELKYSMATPWKGHNQLSNYTNTDVAKAAPYLPVDWVAGFSATSAIKGNPSLQINENTGILTVKASETGLFLFAIQVAKFRNGKQIGLVRCDFQFPVVDCSLNTPPAPIISYKNVPVTEVKICTGEIVTLETVDNPDWAFQWQKNGDNIANATTNKLIVNDFGEYAVIKSLKSICENDTISAIVKVTDAAGFIPKIIAIRTNICNGDTTKLSITTNQDFVFTWYLGNTVVQTGNEVVINKAGLYYVQGKKIVGNCLSQKDSINIVFGTSIPLPIPPLTLYEACLGDSIKLETLNQATYVYQWELNNAPIPNAIKPTLYVKNTGNYVVVVKDNKGCQSTSLSYNVSISNSPTIQFDAISPICLSAANKINLIAMPYGGVFTGNGVNSAIFDPTLAGLGSHVITYTYTSGSGCVGKKSQTIKVNPAFSFSVSPNPATVKQGQTFSFVSKASINNLTYHWTPDSFLDDHTLPNPACTPLNDIVYNVEAASSDGCIVVITVKVFVDTSSYLAIKLYIPSAFTPNGDNQNEAWKILNLDKYPNNEVFIFNRWGETIFHSSGYANSWEGTNQGQRVPVGSYPYRILINGSIEFVGILNVLY